MKILYLINTIVIAYSLNFVRIRKFKDEWGKSVDFNCKPSKPEVRQHLICIQHIPVIMKLNVDIHFIAQGEKSFFIDFIAMYGL